MGIEEGEALYMYWSIDGFPPLANGWSGFRPQSYATLAEQMRGFPDAESVERLHALGVRSVVLHSSAAPGTPWAGAENRPLDGLPLTRTTREDAVLYELAP